MACAQKICLKTTPALLKPIFFPDAYHSFYNVLDYNWPYSISGKMEENWGAITPTMDGIRSLMTQ